MTKQKTFLGVIPARAGSKRLPRKNLLELCGKPLIEWTIEAGVNSKYITEIIVATDDMDISRISKNLNMKSIGLPHNLTSDSATIFNTVKYVIENSKKYDYIVLLQPTSPLRTSAHIDEAIDFLFNKNADAVISVSQAEHNPLWMNSIPSDCNMSGFLSDSIINKKSQELPVFYRLNGAIYICNTEKFLREKTFFIKDKIYAYVMEKESSVDIDEDIDLKLASILKQER